MATTWTGSEIAVIGMAGYYPRSRNLAEFWDHLCAGDELLSFFTEEEARARGVDDETLKNPHFVRAAGVLETMELFDADFFGFMPREAELLDPQQRLLLECTWEVLEHAGYDPERFPKLIGVYVSAVENTYLLFNLSKSLDLATTGLLPILFANGRDYLPTRISYKLNLRGPSCLIQSACSSSLAAIHTACQSLLNGECDMAVAGGVSIMVNYRTGYTYMEGGVASSDGHCRTFDARAQGTIFGSGAGMVALKPLEAALADGDTIHAIICGSALNNDGALKVSYTAPSVNGQAEVIIEALSNAGISAETISYVEAHGTATDLGDTIEIQALTQAFRTSTDKRGFCAIGSVKTNVGHLDAAAGVTGFIKTVLALEHQALPPSLHFDQPNPKIDFASSPFFVNTRLTPWRSNSAPRRAGVSSFGIGGTNAHLILEEAPLREPSGPSRPWQLLTLSAKTLTALETLTANLATHLKHHPAQNLADVAYTLQIGRAHFDHRRMLVVQDRDDAMAALELAAPPQTLTAIQEQHNRPVIFMFPGQGAQYVTMAAELYAHEPVFRKHVDDCATRLERHIGCDLRHVLYSPEGSGSVRGTDWQTRPATPDPRPLALDQTWLAQPALFVVEYALAQLWMAWGIQPRALIGHSLGEYVAACLAGVLTLDDALALVAERARLMQELPEGAMVSVRLSEAQLAPMLGEPLALAAVNAADSCVVSGPTNAIAQFEGQLAARSVTYRRLHTSHAFHSAMVEPILERFTQYVQQIQLHPPQIPYVSNLTGRYISRDEATNPAYWVQHMRQCVRFSAGLQTLLHDFNGVLLELGPGHALNFLARQQLEPAASAIVLSSLPHAQNHESEEQCLLNTLGQLWIAGVTINWADFYAQERRYRVPVCGYPFERKRYWIEPAKPLAPAQPHREAVLRQDGSPTTTEPRVNGHHEAGVDRPVHMESVDWSATGTPIERPLHEQEDAERLADGPTAAAWATLPPADAGAIMPRSARACQREILEGIIAQQISLMSQQIHMLQGRRAGSEGEE